MASARLQLIRSAPEPEGGEAGMGERRLHMKGNWSAGQLTALACALGDEMVPRVGQIRRAPILVGSQPRRVRQPRSHAGDVQILADIVLGDAMSAAFAHLEGLRATGVVVESMIVDVLEPTAARLGDLWLDDRCDLTALALSLTRLQQILRVYSRPLYREIGQPTHDRRVLVTLAPGEQDGFSSALTAEFFYCAGWCVQREFAASADGLAAAAGREWLDIMHLSLSGALASDERVAPLARVIARVRAASLNADMRVLVGGRVFSAERGLASGIGADGASINARDAVARAGRLISGRVAPSSDFAPARAARSERAR